VRATIERLALDLCLNRRPGEGSASVAWVGLQGPSTPPLQFNIVQIGMGRCYLTTGSPGCDHTVMRDFWAYGRSEAASGCAGKGNVAPTGRWVSGWGGGGPYTVEELPDGRFTLTSNAMFAGTGANVICWTSHTVAVSTESWDLGDALGDTAATKLTFSQERFKTTAGGAWQVLPSQCNARSGPGGGPLESVFKCAVNGATIDLWTER
jgi:hypothetical protein